MSASLVRSIGLVNAPTTRHVASMRCMIGAPLEFTRSLTNLQQENYRRSMANMLKRDWSVGDVYAPHDLSAAEMRKWHRKKRPDRDVFDILNVDPMSLYKNISVMSDFVSEMGRIRPRTQTGLRPVNQRKVAKAIRRAIALGLMPSSYRHPEIIKRDRAANARPF